MSTKEQQNQIALLIQLARADGVLSNDEIFLIKKVAGQYEMSEEKIDELFNAEYDSLDIKNLSENERFEYMYTLVELAKIDGRLYQEEIVACVHAAAILGL